MDCHPFFSRVSRISLPLYFSTRQFEGNACQSLANQYGKGCLFYMYLFFFRNRNPPQSRQLTMEDALHFSPPCCEDPPTHRAWRTIPPFVIIIIFLFISKLLIRLFNDLFYVLYLATSYIHIYIDPSILYRWKTEKRDGKRKRKEIQ